MVLNRIYEFQVLKTISAGLLVGVLILCNSCHKKQNLKEVDYESLNVGKDIIVRNTVFLSADTGFAVGGWRYDEGYVFKTIDGGATWETKLSLDNHNLYAIHFMDANNGVACGEFMHYFFTRDGGESWTRKYLWPNTPAYQKDISDFKAILQYNDSTLMMICGDDYSEGVFLKIDVNHQRWSFSTTDHELKGLTFYDDFVFAAGYGYTGIYDAGLDSLIQIEKRGDFYVDAHAFSKSEILMAGNKGVFYRSTDAGKSWTVVARKYRSLPNPWIINDMIFINDTEGIAVGNYGLILYSSNKGDDWEEYRLPNKPILHHVTNYGDFLYISSENGQVIKLDLGKIRA